jgi:hypothetical protein
MTRIGELETTLKLPSRFLVTASDQSLRPGRFTEDLRLSLPLLVMANFILISPILVTLMKKALNSSETSILIRATRLNIPEDDILHSHCRENLKSYIALTGWTLQRRRNVSPVKYELGFYIPEDDILHTAVKTSNLT